MTGEDEPSLLVVAQTVTDAEAVASMFHGRNVRAVAFGQALGGPRFDEVLILWPRVGATARDVDYAMRCRLTLRLGGVFYG